MPASDRKGEERVQGALLTSESLLVSLVAKHGHMYHHECRSLQLLQLGTNKQLNVTIRACALPFFTPGGTVPIQIARDAYQRRAH